MKTLIKTTILIMLFTINVSARDILRVKEYPDTGDPAQDQALGTALDEAVDEVNSGPFGKLGKQNDLARGFADANIFAAKAGNTYAFQNYETFAVMSGVAFSAQMPNIYDELFEILIDGKHDSLQEDILEKGDPYFGVGVGITWLNIGLNMNEHVENLNCNIKYGALDSTIKNFSYNSRLAGIEGNYTFLGKKEFYGGLFRWRGLTAGTGFIYNSTKIHFIVDSYKDITTTNGPAVIKISPEVDLGIETTSYTIPVNLVTSIQTLWIVNLFAGLGFDVNFGEADVIIESESDIEAEYDGQEISPESSGKLEAAGDTGGVSPSVFRLNIMYGIGLNLGPVKLDVQYAYFVSGGYSWGFNFGVVF